MQEKKEIYLMQEGIVWSALQEAVHNSVVQIIVLVREFNWCEPYKQEEQYENYASGFFIDKEGYIVTNFHIVEYAQNIWVHVPVLGKQRCEAFVVGVCPDRDIALLKVTDESLRIIQSILGEIPCVSLGDSDTLQRANSVLVLGYPLGQYHLKSTTGVISGKEFVENASLLQITAPINPGNSGGPLFNVVGQVIGIAVAMIPLAQNVGYAIPINELTIILDDLKKKKLVRKLFFGVRFGYANDEKASFLHNPLPAGLYITSVFPGTIADRAGVQPGDMLYGIGDLSINGYGEIKVPWSFDYITFPELMSRVKSGDEISFVIYRKGERKDIVCKMQELNPFAIRRHFPYYEPIEYVIFAGMVIMELSEAHFALLLEVAPELFMFRLPNNRVNSVLVVTHIIPCSYVYQLNVLNVGSVITHVNEEPVATLDQLKRALEKGKDKEYVSFMTQVGIFMVLSMQKVFEDQRYLEKIGAYHTNDQ